MKKRFCLSILLCFCICLTFLSLSVLAESSGASGTAGTPLSPVEQVFQVVSMVILFGGIALFPVYYVLNRRRRRILSSFKQENADGEESTDETEQ